MAQAAKARLCASSDATASLILDFLGSLCSGPRPYREVMEAWRTSCPRLTVWEDAIDLGWVRRAWIGGEALVALTPRGALRLKEAGRDVQA